MQAIGTVDVTRKTRAAIDDALIRFGGRSVVGGPEVVDALLDLRLVVQDLGLETRPLVTVSV